MSRAWYYANACLYGLNTLLWLFYAQERWMAAAFAAVTVGAVVMARRADAWSYR